MRKKFEETEISDKHKLANSDISKKNTNSSTLDDIEWHSLLNALKFKEKGKKFERNQKKMTNCDM